MRLLYMVYSEREATVVQITSSYNNRDQDKRCLSTQCSVAFCACVCVADIPTLTTTPVMKRGALLLDHKEMK